MNYKQKEKLQRTMNKLQVHLVRLKKHIDVILESLEELADLLRKARDSKNNHTYIKLSHYVGVDSLVTVLRRRY